MNTWEITGAVGKAHWGTIFRTFRTCCRAFLLGLASYTSYLSASVVINETMTSNGATIADDEGAFSDWVELYNRGSATINLSGWGLSDDVEEPFRWTFPSVTLSPGARLLVWASGNDRRDGASPLHTNFSIKTEGEDIVLTRSDGSMADHLSARVIPRDVSYGRLGDGGDHWAYFTQASPGQPNAEQAPDSLLRIPRFSTEPGFYNHPISVQVESEDDAVTLRYTTDGSIPTEQSAILQGSLNLNDRSSQPAVLALIPSGRGFEQPQEPFVKANVVRVRAFREGALPSEPLTGTFFIGSQFENRWEHPVISIAIDPDSFFGTEQGIYVAGVDPNSPNWDQRGEEWEREINLEFFETDRAQVLNQRAGARVHGGASRARAKKSLRLYARSDYGADAFEHQVFPDQPGTRFERLLLRNGGNDSDRSIIRDGFMHTLVQHMRFDTQAYRPAIVFINGEYWGIHNLRERYDDNYLERTYGVDPDNIDYLSHSFEPPNDDNASYGDATHYNQLLDYIAAHDPALPEHFAEIGRRIDLENFLDYHVAEIYLNNTDWPGNNVDLWRLRTPYSPDAPEGHDGRWRWLLYDVDFGFNLYWDHSPPYRHTYNTLAFATMEQGTEWPNPDWSTFLFRRILRNNQFRNDFINRMADQLNTAFHPRRVLAHLDDVWYRTWPGYPQNKLNPEAEPYLEERARWPFIYAGALPDQWLGMRAFAEHRPAALFTHLQSHFKLDAPYTLTVDVEPAGSGRVQVNTVTIGSETPGLKHPAAPFPWSGTYFRDVPVTVTALPAPGFRFVGWHGAPHHEESHTFTANGDANLVAVFEPGGSHPPIAPHPLAREPFTFLQWSPNEPEGAFPPHMQFVQGEQEDPGLHTPVEIPYAVGSDHHNSDSPGYPYNNTSRTRINGLSERGISFINTGRERDLGAAVVALDTRYVLEATVQWDASTERANSRTYALRLQYRVGSVGPFRDVLDASGRPVDYQRSPQEKETVTLGPVNLPPEAMGQAYVELRWKYYFTGKRLDADSGARDELRLDNIIVAREPASFARWQEVYFPDSSLRNDPEVGGPTATPAGDGVTNLTRYALDLPWSPLAQHRLPRLILGEGIPRFEFDIPDPKPDIHYRVDASPDLISWHPIWSWTGGDRTISLPADGADPAPWFLRFQVEFTE